MIMMTNNTTMVEASNNNAIQQQQPQQIQNGGENISDCENSNSSSGSENLRKNLIINYLPPTMDEEEIKSLFSRVGEIANVKLIRDKHGLFADPLNPATRGQSLGYGFVNYHRAEDAEQAIKILNGLRLQNKTIKVSYARPSSESIKDTNLYISGLPRTMIQEELEKIFEPFGTIITSRVIFNASNTKGVGFIRFDKKDEAIQAIQQLNNSTPPGCSEPILVKLANAPANKANLGLNSLVSPLMNPLMSRKFGGAVHNTVNKGLARFSPITGDPMIETMFPRAKAGGTIAGPGAGWSIFIYNLPIETEESSLWALFGPFGAVQGVKIVKDTATNTSKGYGFVTMTNYEEAAMAIRSLNGYELSGRSLQVSFKTSKGK